LSSNTALLGKVCLRALLCIPLAPIVLVLGISVIGIPLALPLMYAIGKFVTKPLMDDPRLKPDPVLIGDESYWRDEELLP
jgi:hypothetical protein